MFWHPQRRSVIIADTDVLYLEKNEEIELDSTHSRIGDKHVVLHTYGHVVCRSLATRRSC